MIAALVDGNAGVVGAFLAALAVAVPTLLAQRKVHADNRADHHETAAKVDELLVRHRDTAADVRAIKADVRDLRGEDRSLGERLTRLEVRDGGAG